MNQLKIKSVKKSDCEEDPVAELEEAKATEQNQKKSVERPKPGSSQKPGKLRPKKYKYRVMLSNCPIDDFQQQFLEQQGVEFVSDIKSEFDILVMDFFRRRVKSLAAVCIGAELVDSKWIRDSVKQEKVLDIKGYLLQIDKHCEQKFQFNYKETLENRARLSEENEKVLSGYRVYIPRDEYFGDEITVENLLDLAELGGAQVLSKLPAQKADDIVVVLSEENKDDMVKYKDQEYNVVNKEFILLSCLRQKCELKKYLM